MPPAAVPAVFDWPLVSHADYFLDTYAALYYHCTNNPIPAHCSYPEWLRERPEDARQPAHVGYGANAVKLLRGLNR